MVRTIAVLSLLLTSAPAPAQVAQFKWTTGQVLVYKVGQSTTATETVDGKTSETATTLQLVKRWQVSNVEANGVATLTMSLERLRMETKTPGGETLLFDSADLAKSTPALRADMAKYINVPLTVVRMDKHGQMVEVKESKFGPAHRLECDLPFKLVLPASALSPNAAWERKFAIKIDGMNGAVDTFPAVQKLTCKSVVQNLVTIGVSNELVSPPEVSTDLVGLLPLLPAGEVTIDTTTGRLKAVKFQIQKDIAGHQGEGSKYKYVSSYVEELAN